MCLALVLAMTTSLFVMVARQNWTETELGALSQYYEIGSVDGKGDPGYVSTVAGDAGGTSFGIYMFASKAGTPVDFAEWLSESENAVYQDMGDQLLLAYNYNSKGEYYPGYGSNFTNTWKNIAEVNKSGFYEAQKDYWQNKYYDGLVSWAKETYGLDVNNYSDALKNVFWSRSVQHGLSGAKGIITNALDKLGGFTYQPEAELISAIYAESGRLATEEEVADKGMTKVMNSAVAEKYGVAGKVLRYFYGNSGGVQMSVYRRLRVNELHDALTMLYQKRNGAPLADGTYIIRDYLSEKQSRVLLDSGVVDSAKDEDAGEKKMVLAWYQSGTESGFYTIASTAGRLTASDGGATFAKASASRKQHWTVEDHAEGGRLLKNVSTGDYLAIHGENKTLQLTSDADKAARWQFSPQGVISLRDPIIPSDKTGNKLAEESSGFPVRGIVTCALPLSNVTVTVKTEKDTVQFQASSGAISTNYYDLWELDGKSKFSSLKEGSYTLAITAKVGDNKKAYTLAESSFTVGPAPIKEEDVAKETFIVTLDAAGGKCDTTTKTYELGAVYGELPEATKDDGHFQGWFLSDGTQVTASTPVAAEDHTITAKYGELYTVTFKPENGKDDTVRKLGEGELIKAPASPIKAADDKYSYSFSHWETADGSKFVADMTFMAKEDITYTAIYNKADLPDVPDVPDTPDVPDDPDKPTEGPIDAGYLTGIVPNTDISDLTSVGYTVYSDETELTSGEIGTGMKAYSGNSYFTIVVTGDVNGDGWLDITDVVKIQAHVLQKKELKDAYTEAADLNEDGIVDVTDVVQSVQYALGKRTFN